VPCENPIGPSNGPYPAMYSLMSSIPYQIFTAVFGVGSYDKYDPGKMSAIPGIIELTSYRGFQGILMDLGLVWLRDPF
jgi:hypothetical protein